MSVKDCGEDSGSGGRKKLLRRIVTFVLSFIGSVTFIIVLLFLILRPTKPHFSLQDATVFTFNLTAGNLLTSTFQITLSSRNPNSHVGIYYDRLEVVVTYHSQQITVPTQLSTGYQGHKDTTVWSPFLHGSALPVASYLAVSLIQEEVSSTVQVNVRVNGRIRWKVGTLITGKYHLYVNCPAYLSIGKKGNAVAPPGVKYQLLMDCSVDI